MSKQVIWTKFILETFIREGCLNEFEAEIMRTRIDGMTVLQQSLRMNCSKSTVEKTIAKLKVRYDEVQKRCPELPVRRSSAQELYMDTH
ncbi:MAG: hypothetical protein MJ095_09115 [Oscillospiraceae bacterium]|nr:hypothetical protein [Oscillospiraceae bacterium]